MSNSKNELFQNILTSILVICAVVVTGVLVYQQFFKSQADTPYISEWKSFVVDRQPILGKPEAPTKIILFSDYQCPFCRQLEPALEELVEKKGAHAIAVYRYEMPLTTIHKQAYLAAIASKCVSRQGSVFDFQKVLFEHADDLSEERIMALAGDLNFLDVAQFKSCLLTKATASDVDHDISVAQKLGIKGVPVLLINGNRVDGVQDVSSLGALISSFD